MLRVPVRRISALVSNIAQAEMPLPIRMDFGARPCDVHLVSTNASMARASHGWSGASGVKQRKRATAMWNQANDG